MMIKIYGTVSYKDKKKKKRFLNPIAVLIDYPDNSNEIVTDNKGRNLSIPFAGNTY